MDESIFYYQFAHLLLSGQFQTSKALQEKANVPWYIARYYLEKKHGMLDLINDKSNSNSKIRQNKQSLTYSFLTGYWADDFIKNQNHRLTNLNQINDDDFIQHESKIVLVRKPMPKGFDPYRPKDLNYYVNNMNDKGKTDQERIDEFVQQKVCYQQDINHLHASIYETSLMPRPSKGYICTNCWKKDHYRQFCQEQRRDIDDAMKEDDKHIILPLPPGFPMTFFEKIIHTDIIDNEKLFHDTEGNIYRKIK